MSIRVRALCTASLAAVTPETLRAAVVARLPGLAAFYGEDGHEATLAALRVEGAAPLVTWRLRYREDDAALPIDRSSDPAEVRGEVAELLATLEDSDEDGVEDVRELLGRVVEVARLELALHDCEGIGWAVAIAAAACFAELGEGLVQADGEGWMLPRGRDVEHVLDGD
jgi:hypothetical protein